VLSAAPDTTRARPPQAGMDNNRAEAVDANAREGYIARPTAVRISRGRTVALVAELVDAQVSGTCGRKVVEVRVFSWAPTTS
jgi:hypothetical protein